VHACTPAGDAHSPNSVDPGRKNHRLPAATAQIDDKSRFLARGGFAAADWEALEAAIRDLAETTTAEQGGLNDYGTFWRTEGFLVGPQSKFPVVLIWLEWVVDGSF
jgi:hypothetical protein